MDIVIKAISSAVVTAIILVIAKIFGPKLAGAIGGIPIVFAISYVLITMGDKSMARDFLVGGIYGALAGIFFSLILIWLNILHLCWAIHLDAQWRPQCDGVVAGVRLVYKIVVI